MQQALCVTAQLHTNKSLTPTGHVLRLVFDLIDYFAYMVQFEPESAHLYFAATLRVGTHSKLRPIFTWPSGRIPMATQPTDVRIPRPTTEALRGIPRGRIPQSLARSHTVTGMLVLPSAEAGILYDSTSPLSW